MMNQYGSRWESSRKKPQKEQVLHVWKNVNPSNDKQFILNEETDTYRKNDLHGKILQMNIFSKVYGDSIAKRNGKLFYYKTESVKEYKDKG